MEPVKELKLLKAGLIVLAVLFLALAGVVYSQHQLIKRLDESLDRYESAIDHTHDMEELKQDISHLEDRINNMEYDVEDLQNDTDDLRRDQTYHPILRNPFWR